MENQDLTRVIMKNCTITSLYGLIIFIFSLVILFTIGGTVFVIMAQVCMSIFSSLTSIIGRRAAIYQSSLSASRYATWSFMNTIIWGGLGAYSTYIEVLILAYFTPVGVAVPVSLIWFTLYISGLILYLKFLKTAKLYRDSRVSQQLQGGNPDVIPGQASPQVFQPGNQGGYQAGYQPGYQPSYQPYPAAGQPVNYFAPGTNVYYGSPINNAPGGK